MSAKIEDLLRRQQIAEEKAQKASDKVNRLWQRRRALEEAEEKKARKRCKGKYYSIQSGPRGMLYLHFLSTQRADVVRLNDKKVSITRNEERPFSRYFDPSTKEAFERAYARALKKITAKK